ncbi:vasopressin V2 receptor-like [Solea senegalensis]|uniref:Vasopressin V2 receptor-like n=1 Tax=Solea senegalensis TaxID=28829 RepID=A0AAV6SMG6_SOLSE|nr:vasopressin V2 receptor-like [Solea senegalensis]XP_043894885.1 vasopressin V2 receptor-like [Solea senegalensis]XP_043894886.1 vasopressin V2 receptor-like [Solea senegalensis]XP_043894887.1 vasopressin V2 receptor-like [Solea senegalensis]KAG7519235.1 vasopressin V2 receptor-like [Solea senegalensis]
MESISVDTDWDGLAPSSLVTAGRNNFSTSSFFVSELNSYNTSHSGGSFFGIFPENGSTTTPHTLPQPRSRDLGLARAEIAVLGVVLAFTTLGNSFVLWVLLRRRKQNAPMHVFMVNLCVADLVVALFQVLPQLIWDITERFQGPDLLCRSIKYLQIVGMFASSYMIVAMTVDRHHAICCPLQAYRGGAMSRWNTPVIIAWALSLILSIPQVFIFSRTEVAPGEYECWGHFAELWGLKAYITWMTVAVFILPALIITICQIRIFREIHNNIYLKSERVVMAEMKKNEVFFRFHGFKKEDERSRERGRRTSGGGGRDGRVVQLLKGANNSPHSNIHNSQVGECYEYAPPAIQYNSCHGEHVTTTTSPSQQQMLNSSDCQESYTSHELASDSPRCSLDYVPPPPPTVPPPSITKAMSKTVRMTLVIVLVYTICWSPFFIVQLWAAWDPNPPDQGVAFTILMLLASLNSCTNPWIYTAFSSSVSRELQKLLHCWSRPGRRGSLPDDSTTTHTSTTKDNLY